MFSQDDDHFRNFAGSLEALIARYGEVYDKFDHQKKQVEELMGLERQFRDALIASPFGFEAYEAFIIFICEIQKNILDARPFFRERQEVFADGISAALKARDPKLLYPFWINYQFILFVMAQEQFEPDLGNTLKHLFYAISKLRRDIIELLLPLGINRARIFFSKTPKSHLQHMDLVQIACEGMMSGVDKYSPGPEGVITKQFRSTVVGRMGGNFIESYSQTLIDFYPVDKRKLYRAHKSVGRQPGEVDLENLTTKVNDGVKESTHQTNPAELADLMAAASTVSADSSLPTDPDAPEPIERFAAPESTRPDRQVEDRDSMIRLLAAFDKLTGYEKKLLRLKGVRFEERSLLDPA